MLVRIVMEELCVVGSNVRAKLRRFSCFIHSEQEAKSLQLQQEQMRKPESLHHVETLPATNGNGLSGRTRTQKSKTRKPSPTFDDVQHPVTYPRAGGDNGSLSSEPQACFYEPFHHHHHVFGTPYPSAMYQDAVQTDSPTSVHHPQSGDGAIHVYQTNVPVGLIPSPDSANCGGGGALYHNASVHYTQEHHHQQQHHLQRLSPQHQHNLEMFDRNDR